MKAIRRGQILCSQIPNNRLKVYKNNKKTQQHSHNVRRKLNDKLINTKSTDTRVVSLDYEECYEISLSKEMQPDNKEHILWLLKETYDNDIFHITTIPDDEQTSPSQLLVQVSPRTNFQTSFSTNAMNIINNSLVARPCSDVKKVRRYSIQTNKPLSNNDFGIIQSCLYDRMVEDIGDDNNITQNNVTTHIGCVYSDVDSDVYEVSLMEGGTCELIKASIEMNLGFDAWDVDYYYNLFVNKLSRNPTNVELFDIAQSNSEHSRHWFFGGELIIDGVMMNDSLMDIVKKPLLANKGNSLIAFKDNSSAIRGFVVRPILPMNAGQPSLLEPTPKYYNLLLTAETHNFPTAICPFPGAETGVGGRIRDTHATGKGSLMGAGTAGYCVGNLNIDNHLLQCEEDLRVLSSSRFIYPTNIASPLQILIDASNGASDYGNKFGEPLIVGFTRTFGQVLSNDERREWLKPIMFSGGIGQIDHKHVSKDNCEIGMLVVKIGGPAYRIGLGGGAASSVAGGDNAKEGKEDADDLDFNAVQRGDAQMAQKLWRVVRACVDMGDDNPIVQIHDQGAGGNCNVIKEIIYPLGAEIDINNITVGDVTMTTLEIWGAEYQENDCILIKESGFDVLKRVCDRERCLIQVVGKIDGSGKIKLKPKESNMVVEKYAVDLDLEDVLGKMPKKQFNITSEYKLVPEPFVLPRGMDFTKALHRVLQMPSVCSKRFLTTKVDRHVTGLIAQQQCVGPLQLPIANFGLMAQTHQDLSGVATSIGEQPIKGLINPSAMARLALTEAVTNICWVVSTSKGLEDIKASVNWMYAAKLKSEGVAMYQAANALADAMIELGCACDGGKDSLSMAMNTDDETVLAPGNLVVSAYVGVPDITQKVTPDLKNKGVSFLLHIDLADYKGHRRIGGSAFAQSHNQLGKDCPDVNMKDVKAFYNVIQRLIFDGKILAGHDISDGGLVVTMLEMAFAGNCGFSVNIPSPQNTSKDVAPFASIFAEDPGVVIQVAENDIKHIVNSFSDVKIPCTILGAVSQEPIINIQVDYTHIICETTANLRDVWESTSFAIDKLQSNPDTVKYEQDNLKHRKAPLWNIPYTPELTPRMLLANSFQCVREKVKVAIIREEGSNGDREMAAAIFAGGMEPWDVTMSDLINKRVTLSTFQGLVFVGGFSYADVFDSAKGWAGVIKFNNHVREEFKTFYARNDTFSLGVCNGCQLMALLGVIDFGKQIEETQQPRFIHNKSGRFESRWVNVKIMPKHNNIWLDGMNDTTIGVWVAHGEGQVHFPCEDVRKMVLNNNLVPLRYTDDNGDITEVYPHNPNGSHLGIAALSSNNGRHLAMMPHPERCFMVWQMPYFPEEYVSSKKLTKRGPSTWLRMFQNAREWADGKNDDV
jgi:phosphoribosylformylglycinamidine synthase